MFINFAFAQAGASGGGQGLLVQLLPLILIFVVFYFLLIRPQQKRVKQHKEMVNALKIGSTVVTSGGIVAKIVKLNDDLFITANISDNVEVKIKRDTIVELIENNSEKK
jgi:preprotein translocase subunit YajC